MVALILLLAGMVTLVILYFGMINVQGYDDGLKERYVNSYRGLVARVYDMGYFSAYGRTERSDKNASDNEARMRSRLEK